MIESAQSQEIRQIVIVGGGTAGWMTAAALCKVYENLPIKIALVESEQIGTVGVGEATIPHLRYFNERLGINEHEFMQATHATYKLGIEFSNWGQIGQSYIHPFGDFGFKTDGVDFYHFWLRAKHAGYERPLEEFSLPVHMARLSRFSYPVRDARALLSTYSYAFHIDASRYAKFLRSYCETLNMSRAQFTRFEGKVQQVERNPGSGDITAVALDNCMSIAGDIFIDCSGFRGLLIDQQLGEKFEDWSHWLPCDRAVAVPSEKGLATSSSNTTPPYTKAIAHGCGWQWQIPLQHRMGNGLVYSSAFMSQDQATTLLAERLPGRPLADFNALTFRTGRREHSWSHNCIAIGLSSGFLEPLESTSIYLIQAAIMKLADLLPQTKSYVAEREEFNREMALEYDRIKDFLILHYNATEREDTEFWRYCKYMSVPDSLAMRKETFLSSAHVLGYKHGLFLDPSWVAVMVGQGMVPKTWHHKANDMPESELFSHLDRFSEEMLNAAAKLPDHLGTVARHCQSDCQDIWPQSSLSLYGVFS